MANVITTSITPLPEAPLAGDVLFDEKADAFLPALVTFSDQLDDVTAEINTTIAELAASETVTRANADDALAASTIAQTNATTATTKAGEASTSATSASLAQQDAATSRNLAATSATNAAASATAAAGYAASMLSPLWHKAGVSPIACDPTFQWRPGQEDMPSIVSSARASSGSRVNEFGLIDYIAANLPRIDFDPVTGECKGLLTEGVRTNLLAPTEEFNNAAWIKTRASITPNAAVAPDGTMTADKLVENTTASNSHYILQNVNHNGVHTFSVFAKAGEVSGLLLWSIGTTSFAVGFNLTNGTAYAEAISGTIPPDISSSIKSIGGGWFLCTASATVVSGTSVRILLDKDLNGDITYTGDGVSGLYIWGAQLEVGAFPTSYIPSSVTFTSRASTATYVGSDGLIKSAAIDTARMNYNPTNLSVAPKLLVEAASTNLLTYSEEFNNAAWIKTRASIVPNAAVAPDGTTTMDKLVEDTTASNSHYATLATITVAASTPYCGSVHVEAEECQYVRVQLGDGFGSAFAAFNLATGGAISSGNGAISYGIIPLGGGRYRVYVTASSSTTSGSLLVAICDAAGNSTYTGDGVSGLYIWGAQLEASDFPTSYIPTTSAQVTRAADVSSSAAATRAADVVTVQTDGFKFNRDGGTMYAEFDCLSTPTLTGKSVYSICLDASSVLASLNCGWGLDLMMQTVVNLYVYNEASDKYTPGIKTRHAMSFGRSDYAGVKDGGVVRQKGGFSYTREVALLYIGSSPLEESSLYGHIRHIAYFPKRISNTDLQILTV